MPIPQHVRDHVALHVRLITNFNEEIARLRALGQRFGSPGRYEYEYRTTKAQALVDASEDRLDEVERLALRNGEDPQALYAGQTRPAVEPWSAEALTWQRPSHDLVVREEGTGGTPQSMPRVSDQVFSITMALYDKGYRRGRCYEDGDCTLTAYLKDGRVLLVQTFQDMASGDIELSAIYTPITESTHTDDICQAIPE